ncbi:MAG: glycosyltransferase family 2 protein, partial [Phenylobacterium sp.]
MVTTPPPSDLLGPGVATPGVSHRPLSAAPDPATAMTVFWEAGLPVAQALTGSDGVTRRSPPVKRRIQLRLSPKPPSVSVVICTRDRPEELRRCLASLPAQTLRPLEVIVVDNASS